MVSVDVSNDSWVCKSHCGNVDSSSIRIGGGERVEVIVISGVGKGIPEGGGYQVSSIVAKWVISIDPLGFNGVAVIVLVDIELDVMGFLHASPCHGNVHPVSDMSGIVRVIALISQGYWEFRVQDFNLWD